MRLQLRESRRFQLGKPGCGVRKRYFPARPRGCCLCQCGDHGEGISPAGEGREVDEAGADDDRC